MYSELNIKVNDLVETNKFAKKFAKFVTPPFFLCLKGEIGSGKTTFTRFLIKQFSKKNINIPSPTFPIVQVYEFEKIKIWHYDLYRIENKEEFFSLDFDLAINDFVIVEWPQVFLEYFPKNRVELNFLDKPGDERDIEIKLLGKFSKMHTSLWKMLKKK
jgi:tRNA threonylcarbamoyl adenosine modification protein YjeE|tara:strand:+ start:10624 stop:11100 length:477 start_codon:yes stop_codon:yes gene_type:complete